MSYRMEYEVIQLGAEAWPSGDRGNPQAIWASRPRRFSPMWRVVLVAALVLGVGVAATYVIVTDRNLSTASSVATFQL